MNDRPTVSLILDFFNSEVLAGAQAYAFSEGLKLDARWSVRGDWSPDQLKSDGLIYGVIDNQPLVERIENWDLPKVALTKQDPTIPQISPDYEACGALAAQTIIEDGAPRLINLMSLQNPIDLGFAKGVSNFAQKVGIECLSIECSGRSFEEKSQEFVRQIQASSYPAGICLPHAGLAYTLQDLLLEEGVRIPEDLAMIVIEKDIQKTTTLAPVPLTTVELDEWHRGYIAAEMVHHLIDKKQLTRSSLTLLPKGIHRRSSTGHPDIKDHVVAKVLKYIRQNFLNRIGVNDIASQTGFSRRVIEKRFRELLNRGVHEEVNRLRIEEAKHRILRAEESITTIAEKCGFSSVHYFSVAFKKAEGLSPKAYQKQHESAGKKAL